LMLSSKCYQLVHLWHAMYVLTPFQYSSQKLAAL